MDAVKRASELGEALVVASENNMIVEICRLLTRGADVNYVHRYTYRGKKKQTTALTQAAGNGHADAARILISRGAEVNKHEPLEQWIHGPSHSSFKRSFACCRAPVVKGSKCGCEGCGRSRAREGVATCHMKREQEKEY